MMTEHDSCQNPDCEVHGIAAGNARQSAFYAAADAAGTNDRADVTSGDGVSRYDREPPATDELRERLALAVLRPHPKVELRPGEWATDVGPVVDELAELVAAVVAEARTEGAIAELEAAANSKHSVTTVVTASTVAPPEYAVSERFDFNQSERARLLARAAALRGVGNQNAEPGVIADPKPWVSGIGATETRFARPCSCGCTRYAPRADQKGTEQ